jgi:outer membrane protein assembly factor BamB
MYYPLAVVPIFVNAGAAILPTIVGAVVTVGSLLLKPRELVRACRRRPWVATGVVGCLVGATALTVLLWGRGNAGSAAQAAKAQKEWAALACDIIRKERLGKGFALPVLPASGAVVFGRDYSRSCHDGGKAPLGLRFDWRFTGQEGDELLFMSSPAVVGERVYAASLMLGFSGNYGQVFCLDAACEGKVLWRTDRGPDGMPLKAFFSSPAVTADGSRIVIGQGLHDDDNCSLTCLDANTGRVLWEVKTPLHVESSPAIRGDLAVVGAGAIEGPDRKPTTHPGMVVAVRISDGTELWRYTVNDPESSPAIGEDGIVYIGSGFNGCAVVALRSQTDAELKRQGLSREVWRAPMPYAMTGAITLAGDLVIAGGGNADYVFADKNPAGVVVALDRRTGAVRWQKEMGDAVLAPIAARTAPDGGRVICPVRSGYVVALNLKDGAEVWRQPVSGREPVLAGAALAGRYVYAVSRDGCLAILDDQDNGRCIQKEPLNQEGKPGKGWCFSTPTVAGFRVFVGSETGGLCCFAGSRTVP